jgi:hypothetical protein
MGSRMRVRRTPEKTILYQSVQAHYLSFRARFSDLSGAELPRAVAREFEGYLKCGIAAHGFLRVLCSSCGDASILPFSCKTRGFCPSCGARKMCEEAAFLRDHVLPRGIVYRQWVLTVPVPLRFRMARNPKLLGEIHGIFSREIRRWIESHPEPGILPASPATTGTVTFVQRFGDGLRLSPHFHLLAPEGGFRECTGKSQGPSRSGFRTDAPEFVLCRAPTTQDVCDILTTIHKKVIRRLERLGILRKGEVSDPVAGAEIMDHGDDTGKPEEQLREAFQKASTENRCVLGNPPGSRVRGERNPVGLFGAIGEQAQGSSCVPLLATLQGFTLHAGTIAPPDIDGMDGPGDSPLERLLRYMARGSTPLDRLARASGGDILIKLRKPWRDGTTRLRLHPMELMERLASLIPPFRAHLIRYTGCFAPNHPLRSRVVALAPGRASRPLETPPIDGLGHAPVGDRAPPCSGNCKSRTKWADLIRRVYRIDVTVCEFCQGAVRVTTAILEASAIARILQAMGLPTEPPRLRPASRAPPADEEPDEPPPWIRLSLPEPELVT